MMAKNNKNKTKYPIDREVQSELMKASQVSVSRYTTNQRTEIVIKADLNDEVFNDIKSAIDDVLNYHGI